MKTSQLAALLLTCLMGSIPFVATAQPFVVSADGLEVSDSATGLIWRRCAEGMTWNGSTCTGSTSIFTHELALAHALSEASASGVGWRLPSVRELSSIVDGSLSNPAIDGAAFPATPASWFWSASPFVGNSANAWLVYFSNGSVLNYDRASPYYVRLVRAGQ